MHRRAAGEVAAFPRARGGPRRLSIALVLLWLTTACSSPTPVDLFPHLELGREVMSTGQLFPGTRAGAPELDVGWSGGDGQVLRIHDASADLGLEVAAAGDHRLLLEIQAPDEGMVMTATVDGGAAGTFPLSPGWNEVEVPLQADLLRHGRNRLRLDFALLGDAADDDDPPIWARALRLAGPDGRSVWPDRPAVVLQEADHELRMPSGSAVDLVARVPAGTTLRSTAAIERPPGLRRAPVGVAVEVIGADGETLASAARRVETENRIELELEIPEHAAPASLPGGSGDELLLRWRVGGPGNAVVAWDRLEIIGAPAGLKPVPERGRALAPPRRRAELGRRDVVLVLLDAARRDAVSAYGGPVDTPAIDALIGSRVEAVTAAAPWTAPSVASLMTGLYPDAHGLEAWNAGVPKSVRSLGESFAADGYRTVFFTQHPVWGAIPTLRRGFEVQLQVPETDREKLPTAEELFGSDDRDTFALVHLLLPHDPYEPPAPWRGRRTDDGGGDRWDVSSDALHEYRLRGARRAPRPPDGLPDYVRARYQETMLWTDALVGDLVSRIDASGRDPLIVLLSDHGEAFYEHGWFLHTRHLYEEMVAVPLLFRWPSDVGKAREVVEVGPVSTVDVMPTLIDLLGLPYAGLGMHGRSLAPWLPGGGEASGSGRAAERPTSAPPAVDASDGTPWPASAYAVTSRVETGEAPPLIAYREGRFKALLDELSGRLEVYDLEADPGETEELSRRRPLLAQWMLQGLLQQRHADLRIMSAWRDAGQETELSPEVIERLRALGYLR